MTHWLQAERDRAAKVEEELRALKARVKEEKFVLEVKAVVFPSLCWEQAASKAKTLLDLGIPVEVRFK